MTDAAQKRAVANYRSRLARRGIVRFELQALESDRELIRALARKLADEGPKARQLRQTVRRAMEGESGGTGGIVAALRRSPLVGADLDLGSAGRPRNALDMIIASVGEANDCVVVTDNERDFAGLEIVNPLRERQAR